MVEVVADTAEGEGVAGAEGIEDVASIEVRVAVVVGVAHSAPVDLVVDSCSIVVNAAADSCRD